MIGLIELTDKVILRSILVHGGEWDCCCSFRTFMNCLGGSNDETKKMLVKRVVFETAIVRGYV
jgi:hypothetical protein